MIDGLKPINGRGKHSIKEVVLTLFLNEEASIFFEKLEELQSLFPESLRTEVPWQLNVEVSKDRNEPKTEKKAAKGFRMHIGTDGKAQWILYLKPRPEGNLNLAPYTLSFHFIDVLNYKWGYFIKNVKMFLDRFNKVQSGVRIKVITLGYLDVFNFTRPEVENSEFLAVDSNLWIPKVISEDGQRHFFVNTSSAKINPDSNYSYYISETVRIQRANEGGEGYGYLSLSHTFGVEYEDDFVFNICKDDAFFDVLEANRKRNKDFLKTVLKKDIIKEIGLKI